ncbi:F-box protein CPR1 [Linum perenne]
MLFEILVKLPAKSLLRFKSLSTTILSLIKSPNFVAAHADHQRTNHSSMFLIARIYGEFKYTNDDGTNNSNFCNSFVFPFLKNPNYTVNQSRPLALNYVGSWNGLICLNVMSTYSEDELVLWNPATSEFCSAPLPPLIDSPWPAVYGFGYDHVSDDYKSIRIVALDHDRAVGEVLSWGKRTWTKFTDEEQSCLNTTIDKHLLGYRRRIFIGGKPVMTKGRMNWMVEGRSGKVLSLQLGNSKFEFEWISPPPPEYKQHYTAFAWKGSLAMIVEDDNSENSTLWLFNDRDSCWCKRLTIEMHSNYNTLVRAPVAIWKVADSVRSWISMLMYRHGNHLALASMEGKFGGQLDYVRRGFEFAETLVRIPGSSCGA